MAAQKPPKSMTSEQAGMTSDLQTTHSDHGRGGGGEGLGKSGVILLGRGNSFSLGSSELIVLHRRPLPPSSPPALSKSSGVNQSMKKKKSSSSQQQLEALWKQAEAVMGAKEKTVLSRLEDFGISESREDTVAQEEEIWHVVQEQWTS